MTFFGLEPYQFIVVSLATVMIFFGIQKYLARQPHQTILKLLTRVVVWGGMIIVALFPIVTNKLAAIIGLEGNINAVILTGFLLVFIIIFKILSVVERIEIEISTLTRKDALRKIHESPKK